MGHSNVRAKVRRRKVVALAAYSRQFTVKNNVIPTVSSSSDLVEIEKHWGKILAVKGTIELKEQRHKQPKTLRKKYVKKYYCKGTHAIRKIVEHPSDFAQFPDRTFHPKGRSWYYEQLVQHKTAKWEKKHPCPIKENVNEPDLFEAQYLPKWKAERDAVIERFRDFVVSVYDKLILTGRFKQPNGSYKEELIAEIKDINGEGHKINDLNPDTSKLLKKAQEITDGIRAKNLNLVSTNLRDHKHAKGRIILPQAA